MKNFPVVRLWCLSKPVARFLAVFTGVLLCWIIPAQATTINIGDFGGVSSNMTFVAASNTWQPTGSPAQLDVVDLKAKLDLGNVTIKTLGIGDILFADGVFAYAAPAVRTLRLEAGGNIAMSQVTSGGSAVNCEVDATGNVTIQSLGWYTNGGTFFSEGVEFGISSAPLTTGGGHATISHTGHINIYGAGLRAGGGNVRITTPGNVSAPLPGITTCGSGTVYSEGINFSGRVITCGGNLEINHTGNVDLEANTEGGNILSRGVNFSTGPTLVQTGGGKVEILHTGSVIVGGIITNGGFFRSTGTSLSIVVAGLRTTGNGGGSVTLEHTGSVLVSGSGVATGGKDFFSKGTSFRAEGGGISTEGGNITLRHTGNISIGDGGARTGGGKLESEGPGSFNAANGGLDIGGSSSVCIVHQGIAINDGGLRGDNPSAQILLNGGTGAVELSQIQTTGNLRVLGGYVRLFYTGISASNLCHVTIRSLGAIDIASGPGVDSKGGSINLFALGDINISVSGLVSGGGNISITSKTSIVNTATSISTAPGTGGALNVAENPPNSITQGTIILGTGNVTLTTNPNLTLYNGIACKNVVLSTDSTLRPSQVLQQVFTDDFCGAISHYTLSQTNFSCSDIPSKIVTLTLFDNIGATLSCMATVTLEDTQRPSIACPNDLVRNADTDQCATTVSYNLPTADDNCGLLGFDRLGGLGPNSAFPVGETVVTWMVTDIHTNTNTCSFKVTVQDALAPSIACPNDLVRNADANQCTTTVSYSLPTADDNCGILGFDRLSGLGSNSIFPVGETAITWMVTDIHNNTNTCSFKVTVQDALAPSIACPNNIVRNADANQCETTVSYNLPTADDNCGLLGFDRLSGLGSNSAFPVGETVVTWMVTDIHTNTNTCSFKVMVQDTQKPSIACPNDVVRNSDPGQCGAVVAYSLPTATDNCGILGFDLLGGGLSASTFPLGNTTVTWMVTDVNALTATCTFKITINDVQPVSIVCPTNVVRNSDPGQCGATVAYPLPVASDNCGILGFDHLGGGTSGSFFGIGTTTVTWMVTDLTNQTATCSFSIAVQDAQSPSIVCPANIVRNADMGGCTAVVSYAAPVATDNCGSPTVLRQTPTGTASGSAFSVGTTTVIWQATDNANLTATCAFTVTVMDTQLPSITCPANLARGTDPGVCTAVVTYNLPVYSDNCSALGLDHISGGTSGSTFPKGTTTVVWMVSDASNNTRTCSFRIIVSDTQAPTFVGCPGNQTASTAPGVCAAAPVIYATPTATDNCGVATVVRIGGPASGSTFPTGNTVVTWRAVDGSGRSSTCTFTVTVTDSEPPAINCPGSIVAMGSGTPCVATVFYAAPTASDNCAGTLTPFLVSGLSSGSNFPVGATVNRWRAIAPNGQSNECTFTVTVNCPNSRGASLGGPQLDQAVVSEDNAGTLDLTIMPNPAQGLVRFAVEGTTERTGVLTVVDALGRMVLKQGWTQDNSSGPFDVSAWPAGLYRVNLRVGSDSASRVLIVANH